MNADENRNAPFHIHPLDRELTSHIHSHQVSQNFTFTEKPFTVSSLVRGSFLSNASSKSGGWVFLGMIPGSLLDVRKRKIKSCILQNAKQKATDGPAIRSADMSSDATSGPNISFPPQKNL
ncbi:unnamed protein product [Spirodela intermedia]|uniref:Uncharacterized protein n=1 Tax=Spirodela intermedia TaxID=51605 RepID=A0A7I8K006_SPIIN|nr:unnamed protein product [Spirodela intermedia]